MLAHLRLGSLYEFIHAYLFYFCCLDSDCYKYIIKIIIKSSISYSLTPFERLGYICFIDFTQVSHDFKNGEFCWYFFPKHSILLAY